MKDPVLMLLKTNHVSGDHSSPDISLNLDCRDSQSVRSRSMGWPVLGLSREGNLSFCRNKATKLMKKLERMFGRGANPGIKGMEGGGPRFFEREGPGAKGL